MIEWIQNNWTSVVGTVAVIGGGMYIPFVRGLVLTGFKTMISETVLKKIAIQIVEKLVKSTKNKLDDVWFAEIKKKFPDRQIPRYFEIEKNGKVDCDYSEITKERIKEILKFIKLEHLGKQSARNLSIGQQQLISIMRALAIRPSFLFLDEPCANLDPQTTQIIENLIKIVSKAGVKIIIVTHDLFQAKRLANDILFFHNGKIIEHTKTKSFFKKPKSKEAKDFQKGLLLK